MFNNPVVFVLGAGASKEYGLPTGIELRDAIAERVRSSSFDDLMEQIHVELGIRIDKSASDELLRMIDLHSIDEVLHYFSSRKEIIAFGKAAIVQLILTFERNNSSTEEVNVRKIEDGWLYHFFSMALSAIRKEEALTAFEKVTLINFNYDRVVEHYLYEALQNRAGLTSNEARESIAKMCVIRPYGSVGPLDWQDAGGIPFGGNELGEVGRLSQSIRTYTEQLEGEEITEQISHALDKASLIIFLGFGFLKQNMALVRTKERVEKYILGTVRGLNPYTHNDIRNNVAEHLRVKAGNVQLLDMRAKELLINMGPSIMARA